MRRTDPTVRTVASRSVSGLLAACLMVLLVTPRCAAQSVDRPAPTEREMASAREMIEAIVERYESESSYRISFTQESYWALADTTISSTGVLLLERPSKLSVRYDDGSTITSNGDTLWVYMAQTHQYLVTDIGAEDTVIDPPRVLRSYVPDPDGPFVGPLVGEAGLSEAGGGAATDHRVVKATLSLVPTESTREPTRVEVTVNPSRGVVTGMVAHTRSGDFTRYRISETLFGVETSPSDFESAVPAGAERIGG